MEHFIIKLEANVKRSLSEIENQESDILKRSRCSIEVLEQAFLDLKNFIKNYTFKGKEDEIKFFKVLKPKLFSVLIFYQKLYNIEMNRPKGGEDEQSDYLKRQLGRLKDFFDNNRDFYKYFRSNHTYLDSEYFLRHRRNMHLTMECFCFERDPNFSTAADFKMAKLMSNEKVEEYLKSEIERLKYGDRNEMPRMKMTWTLKKVFLIELIYLLHWAKAFNEGKTSLKQSFVYFEKVFNIELGSNPSTSMAEMKARRTPFSFLLLMSKIVKGKQEEED